MHDDVSTQQTNGNEVPIRAYLDVLLAQKGFIILFCLSAAGTALALTFVASDKYESATTLSYRPQEVTRLKAEDSQAFGSPSPAPPFEVIGQNLTELVKSEKILRDVVLKLGLHQEIQAPNDGPWYERWYRATKNFALDYSDKAWMVLKYGRVIEEDPVVAATKRLRANVTVVNKTSYIFYIVVRDKYPRRAPMIVDAIASGLVDYLRDNQRAPGSTKKDQIERLLQIKEKEIAGYQSEIERLLTENSFVSSELEAEQTMTRWSELELLRIRLEGQIIETRTRLADIRERQDPGAGGLLQPSDFKKLESDILFTEIELNALLAKYEELKKEIDDLEQKRQKLPAVRNQLDRLQTKLEITRREYVQLGDSFQEALVQATRESSEAEVLHAAVIPSQPVAPIKIYHVGLAGFLSLFLAIGLVYALTYAEIYVFFPPRPVPSLAESAVESS
jgi:uncharacterized protein involved in exopolysaccharide biosynthesis